MRIYGVVDCEMKGCQIAEAVLYPRTSCNNNKLAESWGLVIEEEVLLGSLIVMVIINLESLEQGCWGCEGREYVASSCTRDRKTSKSVSVWNHRLDQLPVRWAQIHV